MLAGWPGWLAGWLSTCSLLCLLPRLAAWPCHVAATQLSLVSFCSAPPQVYIYIHKCLIACMYGCVSIDKFACARLLLKRPRSSVWKPTSSAQTPIFDIAGSKRSPVNEHVRGSNTFYGRRIQLEHYRTHDFRRHRFENVVQSTTPARSCQKTLHSQRKCFNIGPKVIDKRSTFDELGSNMLEHTVRPMAAVVRSLPKVQALTFHIT